MHSGDKELMLQSLQIEDRMKEEEGQYELLNNLDLILDTEMKKLESHITIT